MRIKKFINYLFWLNLKNDPFLPKKPKRKDIYLVSYPKSGNTWIRFFLSKYIFNADADFNSIQRYIPDIHDSNDIPNSLSPRIIKSHSNYNPRYLNTLYIVRDPRSVVISYFYYLRKKRRIEDSLSLTSFAKNWIKGAYFPGDWKQHVKSWFEGRKQRFNVIRYEDLLEKPHLEFKKIIDYLRLNFDKSRFKTSLKYSNFENMSKIESSSWKNSAWIGDSNQEIRFVRKAKAKEWESKLDTECQILIENAFKEEMTFFKYL